MNVKKILEFHESLRDSKCTGCLESNNDGIKGNFFSFHFAKINLVVSRLDT